ncbi:ATP-dependent DNA helicase MER3-like protein [Hibiscus syriacus]|uniref:ATP-dependent DNA helicase MER3-like protein n=1 Tax=Hibiscus syriacus TaxID=106335 RepID=A0A6A2ZZF1_HIBSY|nr:ATP-dependent DNA helicase MER3-like protein [Hibiscus syriacus]
MLIRSISEAGIKDFLGYSKFDAVTRYRIKDGGLSFFSDIALVLIDEVHLLNDLRGVALWKAIYVFYNIHAALPTSTAEWVEVPVQGIKRFEEEMRPVKLTTKVFDILMQYSRGKSALVFCSTSKGTKEAAQRLSQDPQNYAVKKAIRREQIEKYIQEICVQNVNKLSCHQMIQTDQDGFVLKPQGMLRRNEKKLLNDINGDKDGRLRFHVSGDKGKRKKRIQTREEKIFFLANDCLTGNPLVHDLSMSQDANSICLNGCRIAKCMKEYFICKKNYKGSLNSSLLAKSFYQKLWDDSPLLLKQLPGIGMVTAKALQSMGVKSFETLAEADPRIIEIVNGKNFPFGNHIKESLTSLPPKFAIEIEVSECKRQGKSKLAVTLTRLSSQGAQSTKRHFADVVHYPESFFVFLKQITDRINTYLTGKRRVIAGSSITIDITDDSGDLQPEPKTFMFERLTEETIFDHIRKKSKNFPETSMAKVIESDSFIRAEAHNSENQPGFGSATIGTSKDALVISKLEHEEANGDACGTIRTNVKNNAFNRSSTGANGELASTIKCCRLIFQWLRTASIQRILEAPPRMVGATQKESGAPLPPQT